MRRSVGNASRAAVYARYSTDEQRPESIEDQTETCRRFCASQGLDIIGIYADAALSGSSSNRPDYERLKADAERGLFDVVVVESLDRLSRRLSEVAVLHDKLAFGRQKLFACDRGEITPLLAGILGAVGQSYLEDLRVKTKRGLRGKILSGLSAGGISFGYRAERSKLGARRIDPGEAEVVRRIFTLYAAEASPRTIAARLNAEGVRGPGGRPWNDTTIRGQVDRGTGVLNNASYVGRIEWNRCSYVRDPSSGKRVARPNPRGQWEVMEAPELRIVENALWLSVKAQQERVRTEMARDESGQPLNRAHRVQHLLSGLVICGACGEPYAVRNSFQMGCRNHRSKGTCTNATLVDHRKLEGVIADAMRREWLTLVNIENLHAAIAADEKEGRTEADVEKVRMKSDLVLTRGRIDKIVAAIEEVGHSSSLLDKLRMLEAQAVKQQAGLDEADLRFVEPPALERRQIEAALRTISDNLSMIFDEIEDPAIAGIRSTVRGMIEKIVVTPGTEEPKIAVYGRFAGLMQAAGLLESFEPPKATPPEAFASEGILSVVAGAGFEPAAFRL